ncbi:DUF402 domain-containing protein [Paenibacillus roseipurpureus]|uniref:DUF402 domain-containing protein n=1 Tax=Paenibacillus roseopurpureus TaxID=2918901 RepID=A0AA96LRW7_9BACL|nr:DUF402 domain-containing protein [Paenibacillus sp. MBLB1832]WNR45431.1 DUF402 domain-containing protein [Paenibacillus sp. MBLB1832]
MQPDRIHLASVTDKLAECGIPYTLGGSGLLLSLGLIETVNDWDVMVETPQEDVLDALQHYEVEQLACGDFPFGTAYKLLVTHPQGPQVEIIGRLSVYSDKGLCHLPSVPYSVWNGIQVGSPEVWYVAYALMNRREKAEILLAYLKEYGVHHGIIQRMMKEPLPDVIMEELRAFNQITIQALKYGNIPHYAWNTSILEKTDSHIFVLSESGRQLHHFTKDRVFTMPHWTIEFFSFESWFTVSAEVVEGEIVQYYCNINQPAQMKGNTVSFVDLDLDYFHKNGVWTVLDEEEFQSNAIKFAYPEELIQRAEQELIALKQRVSRKEFPFDGAIEKWIHFIPFLILPQRPLHPAP